MTTQASVQQVNDGKLTFSMKHGSIFRTGWIVYVHANQLNRHVTSKVVRK